MNINGQGFLFSSYIDEDFTYKIFGNVFSPKLKWNMALGESATYKP